MYLTSEMHELILISNVSKEYEILCVERDVPTVTVLMEEVLGDEDHGNSRGDGCLF
jgi:hypothetical protein